MSDYAKLIAELWHPRLQSVGSGLLIAGDWVLTAHHVIAPVGQAAKTGDPVEVRLQGDWDLDDKRWYRFEVFWSEPDLDVALLKRSQTESRSQTAADALYFATLANNVRFQDCHCIGFPGVTRTGNQNDTGSVWGTIDTANKQRQKNRMQLQVISQNVEREEDWQGMSGSAVFYQGSVVGVITEISKLYKDNVLELCPVEAVFRHADFSHLKAQPGLKFDIGSLGSGREEFDKYDLPELVCYLDRDPHELSFRGLLSELNSAANQQRSFVYAVKGEKKHEHYALIDRFQRETLRELFGDEPAYQQVRLIDFPARVENVAQELEELKRLLYNELNILHDPQQLIDAFNAGGSPRVFYTFIYSDSFGAAHQELLDRWIEYWHSLGTESLMGVVGLIVCLCTDEVTADNDRGSLFGLFRKKKPRANLGDFQLPDTASGFKTTELSYCRDHHINEWIQFLESSAHYHWSVDHIKPLSFDFSGQSRIAVADVKTAIKNYCKNANSG